MKKLFLLPIAIIFLTISDCNSQNLDRASIRRIADYGKLWAVLTLFHPEMAYNNINPDSLFLNNIHDLLKEPSAANFKKCSAENVKRIKRPKHYFWN